MYVLEILLPEDFCTFYSIISAIFFLLFLEKTLWKQQENSGPIETDLAKEFIDVCD